MFNKNKIWIWTAIFLTAVISLNIVSADTELCRGTAICECGDMSDAGCNAGYVPVCMDSGSEVYYSCVWDDSQDCSNDPSKSEDCLNWCDGGKIYDYSANRCCQPETPYYTGTGCSCNPNYAINCGEECYVDFNSQVTADNYFTRHSECGIFGWGACAGPTRYDQEEKCEGNIFYQCTETSRWINVFENKGITLGKCGVECILDSDCGEGQSCISDKCEENGDCPDGLIRCSDGLCKSTCEEDCIPKTCSETDCGEIDDGCNGTIDCGECKNSNLLKIILSVSATLIILSFIFFAYFKFRKKRR